MDDQADNSDFSTQCPFSAAGSLGSSDACGLATSILIDGHVISDRFACVWKLAWFVVRGLRSNYSDLA